MPSSPPWIVVMEGLVASTPTVSLTTDPPATHPTAEPHPTAADPAGPTAEPLPAPAAADELRGFTPAQGFLQRHSHPTPRGGGGARTSFHK